jgi:PAS domain S-box-containing protein
MRAFRQFSRFPFAAYAVGVLVAGAAAALQWLIHPWTGSQNSFLFFVVGLLFAVTALGRGPAVLVLAAAILNDVALAPRIDGLLVQSPHHLAALLIFTCVGILVIIYGNRLRLDFAHALLAEERLALAQRNAGVGIFELDFGRNTAFVSPSLCRIMGRPVAEGEIPLDEWLAGLRPEHVAESLRVMKDHVARGEFRYEREQRVELPNGEVRWLLNRVELQSVPDGILTQARGVTVDITKRKQVDELLRETQASLQQQLQDQDRLHGFSQELVAARDDLPAAMQGLLEIMVELYGTRHGIVTLCNPDNKSISVVAQAGFDEGAFDDLAVTIKEAAGALRPSDLQELAPLHRPVDDADYESMLVAHRAIGAHTGLRGIHSVPLVGTKGEVMGVISMMFDQGHQLSEREMKLGEVCATTGAAVLERERVRVVSTRNERQFAVALKSSVVPFSILTPVRHDKGHIVDFRWSYVNPAAARAIGREIHELQGNRVSAVLPRAWDDAGLFDRYVGVVERSEQCDFELHTKASGFGARWYNVIASPLQGAVAVWFTDITAKKAQQELVESVDKP